jgi:hypothetical protein
VADYYNFEQLTQKFGITEATIKKLQAKGFLEPTIKAGRPFLSSQQVYRLRLAIRKSQKDKVDLLEAISKVEERWLAGHQPAGAGHIPDKEATPAAGN